MEYVFELSMREMQFHILEEGVAKVRKAAITAGFLLLLYVGCWHYANNMEENVKKSGEIKIGLGSEAFHKITNTQLSLEEITKIWGGRSLRQAVEVPTFFMPILPVMPATDVRLVVHDGVGNPEVTLPLATDVKPDIEIDAEIDTELDTGANDIIGYPTIVLHGNSGFPERSELLLDAYQIDSTSFTLPSKLGKVFDGWFLDAEGTMPVDPVINISEGTKRLDVYAKWKEFPGFVSNEQGMIVGYTDISQVALDGLLAFPTHKDSVGVQKEALYGLENIVTEVYIPPNIVYLPEGCFEEFKSLMYIEVAAGNPAYYSEGGILYASDGMLVCYPAGRNYGLN